MSAGKDSAGKDSAGEDSAEAATEDTTESCKICTRVASKWMIQCNSCKHWIHLACTNLPRYQLFIYSTTGRKFQCELCTTVPEEFYQVTLNNNPDKRPEVVVTAIQTDIAYETTPVAKPPNDVENSITNKLGELEQKLNELGDLKGAFRSIESKLSDLIIKDRADNITTDNMLQKQVEKLKKQLEDKTAEIDKLKGVKNSTNIVVKKLEVEVAAQKKVATVLQSTVDKYTDEVEKLNNSLAQCNSKIEQQKDEILQYKLTCQPIADTSPMTTVTRNVLRHRSTANRRRGETDAVYVHQGQYTPLANYNEESSHQNVQPTTHVNNGESSQQFGHHTAPEEKVDLLIIGNSHVRAIDSTRIYKHKSVKVVSLRENSAAGLDQFIRNPVLVPVWLSSMWWITGWTLMKQQHA